MEQQRLTEFFNGGPDFSVGGTRPGNAFEDPMNDPIPGDLTTNLCRPENYGWQRMTSTRQRLPRLLKHCHLPCLQKTPDSDNNDSNNNDTTCSTEPGSQGDRDKFKA